MFSINQIHKKFSDFATAHLQINSYGFGDLSEIGQSVAAYTVNKDNGTNNITYPSMWVTPQPSSIERHFLKLNFMCLFYDLVNQNEDNSIEVISDTLQMANDFIQYLRTTTNEDNFDIDNEYTFQLTPFKDRFNDDVTGWQLDLQLNIINLNDSCNLPIS